MTDKLKAPHHADTTQDLADHANRTLNPLRDLAGIDYKTKTGQKTLDLYERMLRMQLDASYDDFDDDFDDIEPELPDPAPHPSAG